MSGAYLGFAWSPGDRYRHPVMIEHLPAELRRLVEAAIVSRPNEGSLPDGCHGTNVPRCTAQCTTVFPLLHSLTARKPRPCREGDGAVVPYRRHVRSCDIGAATAAPPGASPGSHTAERRQRAAAPSGTPAAVLADGGARRRDEPPVRRLLWGGAAPSTGCAAVRLRNVPFGRWARVAPSSIRQPVSRVAARPGG